MNINIIATPSKAQIIIICEHGLAAPAPTPRPSVQSCLSFCLGSFACISAHTPLSALGPMGILLTPLFLTILLYFAVRFIETMIYFCHL